MSDDGSQLPVAPSPRRRSSGWTLVELAVAFAVLAVLVALALPIYGGYQERARVGQAIADMQAITTRIASFRLEFGQVPTSIDTVMNPLPQDPWGNPYRYLRIAGSPPSVLAQARKDRNLVPINSDYDLYSAGPDRQTQPPLAADVSQDDVIRANDGRFFGPASSY
jgi:general secretion pathway protein G